MAMRNFIRQKTWFLPAICLLFAALPLGAQNLPMEQAADRNTEKEEFWISPLIEVNMYSLSSLAIGGGLAFAYGDDLAIGFRTAWFTGDNGEVITMEMNILLRFNNIGGDSLPGLFVQIGAGPVLFAQDENMSIPAPLGSISAGASLGWRLPFGPNWFVEPALRIGFPYMLGLGVSGGYRF